MIKIFATGLCVASLAIAAPAFAQAAGAHVNATIPGEIPAGGLGGISGSGDVNRTIPGTPGTSVRPATPHVAPAPLLHDGLYAAGTPSINAANRANGTVGQQAVTGVNPVRGVRPVGSGPLNQHAGVDRP